MTDITEDTDIIIEPDEPVAAEPKIEVQEAEDGAKDGDKPQPEGEGLDTLKRNLERERAGRLEAERRAATEAQGRQRAEAEVSDTNLSLVTNAIETVKARHETFKAKYRAARETGDIDAETEALEEMQRCISERAQLETGKVAMEGRPKPQEASAQPAGDPVDHLASQLSPRSAAWVRSHPEYARDERLYRRMLAAHNLAETDGIAPDTDEYFEAIEGTLGIRPAADDPSAAAAQPVQRRAAPAAAPVSRSGTGEGSRPNVVRLTAAQREAAAISGLTEQEYAKQLIRQQRETQH